MTLPRVLFLCTHNSARSQMAEGLLRAEAPGQFEVFSAGTEATRVRPEAIHVMREIGIDISFQESKTFDRYLGTPFDIVITVCDAANTTCPVFLGGVRRLHWSIADPTTAALTEERRLVAFRIARDDLHGRIEEFLIERDTGGFPK